MNKMQSGKQGWLGHCLNCMLGRHPEWRQCMLPVRSARHMVLVRAATGLSRLCEWRLSLSPGTLATEAWQCFQTVTFMAKNKLANGCKMAN